MGRRKDPGPRPRRSPTETVADVSSDHMDDLHLPELPRKIPDRLSKALHSRVEALLYQQEGARRARHIPPLEIRLVRDAHRAVLTACELGLSDGEVFYARFRELVEELGYERTEVGFRRTRHWPDEE